MKYEDANCNMPCGLEPIGCSTCDAKDGVNLLKEVPCSDCEYDDESDCKMCPVYRELRI